MAYPPPPRAGPTCDALYDSGASRHMPSDHASFVAYRVIEPREIRVANGETISAVGVGQMVLVVPKYKIKLIYVLYAPKLGFTLISIAKTDDAGYSVVFAVL